MMPAAAIFEAITLAWAMATSLARRFTPALPVSRDCSSVPLYIRLLYRVAG